MDILRGRPVFSVGSWQCRLGGEIQQMLRSVTTSLDARIALLQPQHAASTSGSAHHSLALRNSEFPSLHQVAGPPAH